MNSLNIRVGRVFLVGAGPGDPGLITVRGAEKLREADVVLHDGLANPAFRSLTKPHTEWISVGKHGGERIWKQSEINDAIVVRVRQGKTVVRLKGGDTGIFARSAEELERLVLEGIPFEVVPGITAASAAAAYTGIPITHRDWSSAVAFVTGQQQPSDGGPETDESSDWEALAHFPGTLVVYMGVTTASYWSNRLIASGKSPQTPVALVRRCSWPDQAVIYCELDQVASKLTPASHFRPPVIAIVGPVAHLGTHYDWFSKRPLFGKTILVTRPEGQAGETVQRLNDLGANVLVQSAIEIHVLEDFASLDEKLRSLDSYDWIAFTSTNGVEHFFSRLHALGMDGRSLHGSRLAGVGPSIVTALARWKMACDLIPNGVHEPFNAMSLANAILRQPSKTPSRCLVVRTNRGKSTIEDILTKAGFHTDSVVAYQTVDAVEVNPEIRRVLQTGKIDSILITSPSAAFNLCTLFGTDLRQAKLVAISLEVAETLKSHGFMVSKVALQSSIDAMIDSLIEDMPH